jgi:outer membrane receptor for ferrienterochelin and colicins
MGLRAGLLAALVAVPHHILAETNAVEVEPQAGADTNSLADLTPDELINVKIASVYSASKHEQKIAQAPSAVSIVSSQDIQRFGHRTLADVLKSQ